MRGSRWTTTVAVIVVAVLANHRSTNLLYVYQAASYQRLKLSEDSFRSYCPKIETVGLWSGISVPTGIQRFSLRSCQHFPLSAAKEARKAKFPPVNSILPGPLDGAHVSSRSKNGYYSPLKS